MTLNRKGVAGPLACIACAAVFVTLGGGDAKASTCGVDWAHPGKYKIAGSFRGKKESTNAFLGKDCRIVLQVPGVYTGGKVKKAGSCLTFDFKVEGDKTTYNAKWCETYGLVPWQGKTLRAAVTPQFKVPTSKSSNF